MYLEALPCGPAMADVGASNTSVEFTGDDVLHAPIGGDIAFSRTRTYCSKWFLPMKTTNTNQDTRYCEVMCLNCYISITFRCSISDIFLPSAKAKLSVL